METGDKSALGLALMNANLEQFEHTLLVCFTRLMELHPHAVAAIESAADALGEGDLRAACDRIPQPLIISCAYLGLLRIFQMGATRSVERAAEEGAPDGSA